MHPIIESKRREVADLFRRSGVKRLAVFDSAARNHFDPCVKASIEPARHLLYGPPTRP